MVFQMKGSGSLCNNNDKYGKTGREQVLLSVFSEFRNLLAVSLWHSGRISISQTGDKWVRRTAIFCEIILREIINI